MQEWLFIHRYTASCTTTIVSSANAFFRFVFVLDGTIHTPYLRSRDPFIIYVQQNLCFAENGFFINTSLLLFSLLPTSHYYFLLPIYHYLFFFHRLIQFKFTEILITFGAVLIRIILTNNYDPFAELLA